MCYEKMAEYGEFLLDYILAVTQNYCVSAYITRDVAQLLLGELMTQIPISEYSSYDDCCNAIENNEYVLLSVNKFGKFREIIVEPIFINGKQLENETQLNIIQKEVLDVVSMGRIESTLVTFVMSNESHVYLEVI